MSELSATARDVVLQGKNLFGPTAADRARVTSALSARLGEEALSLNSPPSAAAPVNSLRALTKALGVLGTLGLVAVGTVLYKNNQTMTVAPPPQTVVAVTAAPLAPPLATMVASEVPAEAARPKAIQNLPAPASRAQQSARTHGDSLGEEVAILTRASKELHSGNAQAAMLALDEHQRRFPSGALAWERSIARVRALCAMGRGAQAEAESARLTRASGGVKRTPWAGHPCASK